jgi:hypothetical protein
MLSVYLTQQETAASLNLDPSSVSIQGIGCTECISMSDTDRLAAQPFHSGPIILVVAEGAGKPVVAEAEGPR